MGWQSSLMYPLLYVEWSDPTSVDDWTEIAGAKHDPNLIKTCGFLVHNKESSLVLALNLDEGEDAVSCFMIIPKCLIIRQFEVFSSDSAER